MPIQIPNTDECSDHSLRNSDKAIMLIPKFLEFQIPSFTFIALSRYLVGMVIVYGLDSNSAKDHRL